MGWPKMCLVLPAADLVDWRLGLLMDELRFEADLDRNVMF